MFNLLVCAIEDKRESHWCEDVRSMMEQTRTALITEHGQDTYGAAESMAKKKTQ